jgi:predicted dehydrogenase
VQGVVVATPTSTHAAVVDEVLTLGVPVFCEKPLTNDPQSAWALAARASDRLFVMDKWRYHPGVMALACIARSGELGPVQGVKTRRLGWGDRHPDVNCAWTLLPHELAIALEILGDVPAPTWATAEVDASGMLHGLTTLSHVQRRWHLSELGIRTANGGRGVVLLCQQGTAGFDDSYSDHIWIARNPKLSEPELVERRPTPVELPLLAELRAFVTYLQGGPPPRSTAAEAAAVVDAIDTALRLAGIRGQAIRTAA